MYTSNRCTAIYTLNRLFTTDCHVHVKQVHCHVHVEQVHCHVHVKQVVHD